MQSTRGKKAVQLKPSCFDISMRKKNKQKTKEKKKKKNQKHFGFHHLKFCSGSSLGLGFIVTSWFHLKATPKHFLLLRNFSYSVSGHMGMIL